MGTSQAEKAASHDRILDIASARIRREGIDSLTVAQLMKDAGLTHGGFYRHFDSREHLVAEAVRRALVQGSAWTTGADRLRGQQGFAKLVDGYLSEWHRDHPESGCGVAGIAADVARSDGSARTSFSQQVQECLAVLADLLDEPDGAVAKHEAMVTLSVLVGAISLARAVDDPELSKAILTNAATALKDLRSGSPRRGEASTNVGIAGRSPRTEARQRT